jgi:hypothetical protein
VKWIETSVRVGVMAAVLIQAAAMAPAFAHHSFGRYDMTRTATVEGVVVRYEWSNPHCWLFVNAGDAGGKPVAYGFEMSSLGEMVRRGWTKTVLKAGDRVKVDYHPMRDGKSAGLLMSAYGADGKLIGKQIRGGEEERSEPPASRPQGAP